MNRLKGRVFITRNLSQICKRVVLRDNFFCKWFFIQNGLPAPARVVQFDSFFLQMNHLVGPACSKEDFPSTETLLPPACLVNIFTPDPPKKLRAGPREDWLRAPRRSLTDWSVAECQSQRTRPTSTPKTWHSRPWEKTHQSEEGVRLLDPASPGWHQ